LKECRKKPAAHENDLSDLLAGWRDDFRTVVSEFEAARARIRELEQTELRESELKLEIEELQAKLARYGDKIKRLSLQATAAKSLETFGKLKDRKISFLEQERLETAKSYSAIIDDLRDNLQEKNKRIFQLENSIHRHEQTLASFQQHLATLRRMYAEFRSAENSDNDKTQVIEDGRDVTAGPTQSDPVSFDEFQVMGAEEFLKTQVINMKEPLLKARTSSGK